MSRIDHEQRNRELEKLLNDIRGGSREPPGTCVFDDERFPFVVYDGSILFVDSLGIASSLGIQPLKPEHSQAFLILSERYVNREVRGNRLPATPATLYALRQLVARLAQEMEQQGYYTRSHR